MGAPDFKVTMGLAGAATVATGIDSIINIVGKLTEVIEENARAVHEYSAVIQGHAVDVAAADEATAGLIDTVELHRGAATLEAAGIELTSQQFRALSVAAADFAQRTGQDVTETFQRLYNAVRSAESEALKPFGMELRGTGTLAQRQTAIMEQLTREYGEQEVAIRDNYEAISQLRNAWGTAWSEMLLAVERNAGPIRSIISGVTSELQGLTAALETQRRAQDRLARMGNESRLREIEQEVLELGYSMQGGELGGRYELGRMLARRYQNVRGIGREVSAGNLRGVLEEITSPDAAARARAQRLIQEYELLQSRDIEDIRRGRQQAVPTERTRQVRTPTTTTLGGGGGGRGRRPYSDENLLRDIGAVEEPYVSGLQREIEAEDQRLLEMKREIHDEHLNMIGERRRVEEEAAMHHMQLAEKRMEAEARATEQLRQEYEKQQQAFQKMVDDIATGYSITESVVGGFTGVFREAYKENEKATRAISIVEGTLLTAFNVGKAVTETALAISDYTSAGRHASAAAAHWAAAAISAAKLGSEVSASKSGGAPSGGNARPEYRSSSSRMRGGDTTIMLVQNGPVTSRQVNDELRRLERDAGRGNDI